MNFCVGLVVSFIFASCIVTGSEGLNCYSCTACNDPFDSSQATSSECVTTCYKGKASDGVIRGCSVSKAEDGCVEVSSNGETGQLCTCNSDNCNSSSIPKFSISVLLLVFAVKYLFNYAL